MSVARSTPPGELEAVACPLCGSDDDTPLFEKDGFRFVRCRACDLAFVNPRLTPSELSRLYNEQVISGAHHYVSTAVEDTRSYTSRVQRLEQYQPPGRLLEIGCGPGTLMQVARERGWDVRGLEINAQSVAHARGHGLPVIEGVLPHPELAGAKFDAIVMNDVIEHIPDPRAAADAVHELLEPGGIFFLTTPDIGSPVARLLGSRWVHVKPLEHLVYFNRRTIRRFLEERGFEVLDVRSVGRVRNLGVAIERLEWTSWKLSRIAKRCVPRALAGRVNLPVNPGDEMAIVARRR